MGAPAPESDGRTTEVPHGLDVLDPLAGLSAIDGDRTRQEAETIGE